MNKLIYYYNRYINNERGMGIVEIAMIILVLITLATIFNTQIQDFADKLFQQFQFTRPPAPGEAS